MYIRIEFYIMSIAGFQKHLTENAFTSHYIEYRQDKFMNFPCGFFLFLRKKISNFNHNYTLPILTEVAGEGGPHSAPQKFLLSQKFRHLMRCKKCLEKNFHLA